MEQDNGPKVGGAGNVRVERLVRPENGSAYHFTNQTGPMWSVPMRHVYHINDAQLEKDIAVLRDRLAYLKDHLPVNGGKGYIGREIGTLIRVLGFLGQYAA